MRATWSGGGTMHIDTGSAEFQEQIARAAEAIGQCVDCGGPGPSRLTLTRVTDDGLWRAETGKT